MSKADKKNVLYNNLIKFQKQQIDEEKQKVLNAKSIVDLDPDSLKDEEQLLADFPVKAYINPYDCEPFNDIP